MTYLLNTQKYPKVQKKNYKNENNTGKLFLNESGENSVCGRRVWTSQCRLRHIAQSL